MVEEVSLISLTRKYWLSLQIPSFRLTILTDLHKYIKNRKVNTEVDDHRDIVMEKVLPEKERNTSYNYYTDGDRLKGLLYS